MHSRACPWHAWNYGQARSGGTQALTIHSVPAPASLFHPVPWVEWGKTRWCCVTACLRSKARAALLHLDLHAMNVLVERGNICAVLDWANTRAGDPRADLAWTASILRFAPLAASFSHRYLTLCGEHSRLAGGAAIGRSPGR